VTKKTNIRALAASICWHVIDQGQSLDRAFTNKLEHHELSSQDRGFLQELVYGVIRWHWQLDDIANQLLTSRIRNKDRAIHFLLLVGLYQLTHLNTPEHAAVSETVNGCINLKKQWAKNLLNSCLRRFLREDISSRQPLSHPKWLIERISTAWPDHSEVILQANNERPPMCLRINARMTSRQAYLSKLQENGISANEDTYSKDGIRLTNTVPVSMLPDFFAGYASVQDTAAQLACDFLKPEPNHTILDACAAPGGKTAHILERTDNQCTLHALDISATRCEQLQDTLTRLQLDAVIQAADASQLDSWSKPEQGFDRILIDAPCSGIGVIRRHPDIKHHRQAADIMQLMPTQQQLLVSLWKILKPSGHLLYMTCSILPEENEQQIATFIAHNPDANAIELAHPNALSTEFGVQTLPGVHDMDGFYYCLLEKHA